MILFLYGEDTFRSRAYVRQSVCKFKEQRDPGGYNVVTLDGKKAEATTIIAELKSVPFLAEKRMVIVENMLSNSSKETLGAMLEAVKEKKIPESTVAIFWQGDVIGKTKEAKEFFELLKKEKYAQEFNALEGDKLLGWIDKECKERGGKIQGEAARYLAENSKQDMWKLSSTLDELVAYAAPREIVVKDVVLFVDEKVDDNAFSMIEAVVMGRRGEAYKLLNEQRRLGEDNAKIFGLFVWQLRILLEIADVLERDARATSDIVAKQLGIHPFVAKKNFAAAKRLSLAKLHSLYADLLDIDIKTKTGQGEAELMLDLFIQKI